MEAGSSELTEPSQGNKMEDTVTLARQEREKQGLWEAEVSYEGEVDLHKHLTSCNKNPGHTKFIPVDQFTVDHLPPFFHDDDLVDWVRHLSDLTVRLSVKYVSDSRPEIALRSDIPFPRYKDSPRGMMRTGTGLVWRVTISDINNVENKCYCKECVNSPTPKTQVAYIYIHTAAHVVYDDLEAAHTTCHLFFDKGGTPKTCNGVVALSGLRVVKCWPENDKCELKYVTHDIDLARKLREIVVRYTDLSEIVWNRYNLLEVLKPEKPDPMAALTIIVSHPHGCSKQVSVGHYTLRENNSKGFTRFMYTTSTCPGSSGAHAFVVGRGFVDMFDGPIHCGGSCEEGQELNFCGYDRFEL